jgi:hypothetical protein
MAIEFLKADNNRQLVRPQGRTFPVGLGVATSGPTSVDYLVIAGGGSGGSGYNNSGSGGGAGGYRTASNFSITQNTGYSILVG